MSCTWPIDRTCFEALPDPGDDPDNPDPDYVAALERQTSAENTAVMVLNQLTAGLYGQCETIARPCPSGPRRGLRSPSQVLLWWDGANWLNGCGCVGRCRYDGPSAVHLPGPAAEIITVTVGSDVLDESEYVLENNRLYRRFGKSWPSQDLGRPMGEQGTWSVKYLRGLPVPAGGDKMAGLLAQEFVSACDGGVCRLPRSVIQTTRSGVTHTFDATKMLANGKVGIPEIDLWLNALNPNHLLVPPSVI